MQALQHVIDGFFRLLELLIVVLMVAMVAMGMARATVQQATTRLLKILLPRFQGWANTVARFSSVGVKTRAELRVYTSRGVLKAVSMIQTIGSTMVPMISISPSA